MTWYLPVLANEVVVLNPNPDEAPVITTSFFRPIFTPPKTLGTSFESELYNFPFVRTMSMSALSVSIPEMSESLTLDIDASRGEAIVLVMVFLWTVAAGPKPVTNGAIRHVAARRIRIAILLYYVVLCCVVLLVYFNNLYLICNYNYNYLCLLLIGCDWWVMGVLDERKRVQFCMMDGIFEVLVSLLLVVATVRENWHHSRHIFFDCSTKQGHKVQLALCNAWKYHRDSDRSDWEDIILRFQSNNGYLSIYICIMFEWTVGVASNNPTESYTVA